MDQELARDAAFVVIAATDVGALDDREYREAQLAAGLVEGRLHLLAYALGASASGMTFIDSEVPSLLGEPLDGLRTPASACPTTRQGPAARPARRPPSDDHTAMTSLPAACPIARWRMASGASGNR